MLPKPRLAVLLLALSPALPATYEVGPGRPLARIGEVPWARLAPGDLVLIHWRPDPYRETWVIGRSGTRDQPIVVRGVPSPEGRLPVIDGQGAVSAPGLDYWNRDRGVIKVGGSSVPNDAPKPAYITIENLIVRGARSGNSFDRGAFAANAAGIYVERGDFVTIRGCVLEDNGNGLFFGDGRDALIEHNTIRDNGYGSGDSQHHNVYLHATGIILQYNFFGRLKQGSEGNNIKDRSAGLVARYNWVEGGNRQFDLVDAPAAVVTDPRYGETFVYGNVMVEFADQADNAVFLHYGGDSGARDRFRRGTLYVYNNTFVSFRSDFAILAGLTHEAGKVDVRNNIFFAPNAAEIGLNDFLGAMEFGHNWLQRGWVDTPRNPPRGVTRDLGGNITGVSPGFADADTLDLRITSSSPAFGAAGPLAPGATAFPVSRQYVLHARQRERERGIQDIGAFGWMKPSPAVNPASAARPVAPYSLLTLHGQDLATRSSTWTSVISGGVRLPVRLEDVSVKINGKDAYIAFVSPSRINVLTPRDSFSGETDGEVATPFGAAPFRLRLAPEAPLTFAYNVGSKLHAMAFFANELAMVGPAGPAASGSFNRPARPGDLLTLYATGLGETESVPEGEVLTAPATLRDPSRVKVTIGGVEAKLTYVAMTMAGVFQINLEVPTGIRSGELPVLIKAGDALSQPDVVMVCLAQ